MIVFLYKRKICNRRDGVAVRASASQPVDFWLQLLTRRIRRKLEVQLTCH